jgi:ABC-type amino acid transport substrate-binding protein
MAHALALDLGVEVAIVRTNWGTLMEDMVQKTLFDVAVGGITDTLARRKHVAFSDATAFSGKTILLPCALLNESGALHPKVMADLYHGLPTALNASDLVIAVNAGGTNYQFVHKYAPAAIKLVVAQGAQPEALLRGDAHVVVTDSVEAELMSAWYPSQVLF